MATISVGPEVLSDDLFTDHVQLLRQREWVGADGRAKFIEDSVTILASMQANSADDLVVTPDLRRTGGTIEVVTRFPLLTETKTRAADVVVWRGCRWMVISANQFGNFGPWGAGHCEAVAEFLCLNPPAVPPELGLVPTYWDENATPWDSGNTTWDKPNAP